MGNETATRNETRSMKGALRAIRATANSPRRVGGMIPFNAPSELLCDETGLSADDVYALRAAGGCFREQIAPGAFNYDDVRALVDHKSYPILGRTSAGTFRLEQKDDGLHYELDVPATPAGDQLFSAVDRGDIGGVSFDFGVRDGGEAWDFGATPPLRTLRAIDISEISFVGTPAYSDTSAATRAIVSNARSKPANPLDEVSLELMRAEAELAAAEVSELETRSRANMHGEPTQTRDAVTAARSDLAEVEGYERTLQMLGEAQRDLAAAGV